MAGEFKQLDEKSEPERHEIYTRYYLQLVCTKTWTISDEAFESLFFVMQDEHFNEAEMFFDLLREALKMAKSEAALWGKPADMPRLSAILGELTGGSSQPETPRGVLSGLEKIVESFYD
jgi:hypothetical protein